MRITLCRAALSTILALTTLNAQQPANTSAQTAESAMEKIRPTYVLGPGDQILLRAFEVEEISDKPFRIDSEGNVALPLLGKIHAAGLTVEQLEADLLQRLKSIVKNPQVVVSVVQFRSEPVFFVGAFRTPGIYPLQGRRTLVEMLTSVGGLQPNASRRIKVTRRLEFGRIPLPNAANDPDGKTTSVEISMGTLRENVNPAEDIVLEPFDVISVERAEMVYVNGEVGRVGGFALEERESISVTKLITMSGGLGRDAAPQHAKILRPVLNTSRRAEISINLKNIMNGKDNDFPLLPNDVLYVPRSSHRVFWSRVALIALPIIPTLIYLVLR